MNLVKKLYVGNLPYTVTDDQLREFFLKAGEVLSAVVILDKHTRRSKRFGFVEMADDEAATSAIQMFHGKEMDGRTLVVNEARPREDSR